LIGSLGKLIPSPHGLWGALAVLGFAYGVHLGATRAEAVAAAAFADMRALHARTILSLQSAHQKRVDEILEVANAKIDSLETYIAGLGEQADRFSAEVATREDVCIISAEDAAELEAIR